MSHKTKLEEIAIEARERLLSANAFNDSTLANNYSATHTNAKADTQTPSHGKGTGTFLDTANGGSAEDIYGVASSSGSGRIANLAVNEYNEENGYHTPDMSGNIGQVTI